MFEVGASLSEVGASLSVVGSGPSKVGAGLEALHWVCRVLVWFGFGLAVEADQEGCSDFPYVYQRFLLSGLLPCLQYNAPIWSD